MGRITDFDVDGWLAKSYAEILKRPISPNSPHRNNYSPECLAQYKQPDTSNYLSNYFETWGHVYKKQFDHPYLLTIGADNGGHVRYQILPCYLHGHRVNLVSHHINVNPNEKPLEIDSGDFHCINCGLLGSEETLKRYNCR